MKKIMVKIDGEWRKLIDFRTNRDEHYQDWDVRCVDDIKLVDESEDLGECKTCGVLPSQHHKYQSCLSKPEPKTYCCCKKGCCG